MKKSVFNIRKKKGEKYDNMSFPYEITHEGIGVTHYNSKSEAIRKLKEVRKKERMLLG